MIARFFEKYPEYVDKTFLSVKVSRGECACRMPVLTMPTLVPREDSCLGKHARTARECSLILIDSSKLYFGFPVRRT